MKNETDQPAGVAVDRGVKPLRVAATILVPLLVLAAGAGVAVLTRWLDQFLASKATMVLLLAALVGWMAWQVWTWPDWRRDDED